MNLDSQTPLYQWLSYLEKSHTKTIDLGLERISQVAKKLNLSKPAPLVITVGGTNGKGTTCRFLEMLFLEMGLKVGVYSSPHLIDYRERVRINNKILSAHKHCQSFDFIEKNRDISLSYFEFSTLSALNLFQQAKLDVVILEVGLGGRLDATNVVDSDIAIVTSIDFDHIKFLGDSLDEIGYEKAGIFRSGKPAIIGEPNPPQTTVEYARTLNCRISQCNQDWHIVEHTNTWDWVKKDGKKLLDLPLPNIPLANAGTAFAILDFLPFEVSSEVIENTLKKVSLVGRLQLLPKKWYSTLAQKLQMNINDLPTIILDVGHNPHASRYLARKLSQNSEGINIYSTNKIAAICGVLKDKDLVGILMPLADKVSLWCGLTLEGERGQRGENIVEKLNSLENLTASMINSANTMSEALQSTLPYLQKEDKLLIFGSFHTVAEFYELLEINSIFAEEE